MSVVIAYSCPGGVWLVSDSLTTHGDIKVPDGPKVFHRNGYGVGVCGDVPVDTALRYAVDWPLYDAIQPFVAWVGGSLLPYLRAAAKEENEDLDLGDSEMLLTDGWDIVLAIALEGVLVPTAGYWACGSGAAVALGSLHSAGDVDNALEAACRFDSACGGELHRIFVSNNSGENCDGVGS